MKRFIAIEDDNSPAYTQAEIHAEVLPDVNTAFADVLNTHNDLVEAIDVAHRGQEVAETLTTVADGLSQPGVTAGGMGAVEVAVEDLLQSVGYQRKIFNAAQQALPAEERRILAVESIREKVGDIWHRLSMFMKMVMDKIKAFFESIFNFDQIVKVRAGMLKKKAAALFKEKAQLTAMDLKNKAGHDVAYENEAFGLFSGGTDEHGKLDIHLIDFTGKDPKLVDKIAKVWKRVDYYVDNAQKGIDSISGMYKRFEQLQGATGEALDNALLTIGQEFFKEFNAGETLIRPMPFGRKYIEIKTGQLPQHISADTMRAAISSVRVTTQNAVDDGQMLKMVSYPFALPLSALESSCDDIIKMVDQNAKVRKLLSSIESAHRQADAMARKSLNGEGEGAYKLKQFASTVIHTKVKIELTLIREYYELACRMHRLMLGYVAWCLSQYSKL